MIKNFGPVFRHHCSHCNNQEYWSLTRLMTWFTLFFIPIFPYEIKYFLTCPICQYGTRLDGDQVGKAKLIAETNQLFLEGKISKEAYTLRLNTFNGDPKEKKEEGVKKFNYETTINTIPRVTYCRECGKELEKEVRFCGNCGIKIVTK